MAEFRMPSLGADMEFGTLHEWYVQPGDRVQRGQVIAQVETEKGVIEVEVWEEGVVTQLLAEPGTELPVGAVLAILQTADEPEPIAAPEKTAVSTLTEPHPMDQKPLVAKANGRTHARPKISPAARKRAQELGIDLSQLSGEVISLADVEQAAAQKAAPATPHITPVARKMAEKLGVDWQQLTGTGNHGAICKEDIEQAARPEPTPEPAPKPAPQPEPADFQTGMRRAIARAMSRSNADIPHYYLETRINMAPALAWLEGENLKRPLKDRLLTAVLLIKAVARALGEVPALNGYWRDDEHQPQEAIHIGFAIALRQGGLIAPAIHHADLKSLDELMAALRDLIMRTRNGRLRGSEMTDATITLTNLGDLGVEKVFGVIYPPQVALVGFGKISDQVWVENGMIGVRPVLTATLAADHRATDGRIGGKFLDLLKKYLEEPAWMGDA